jgi:hypothetical protein
MPTKAYQNRAPGALKQTRGEPEFTWSSWQWTGSGKRLQFENWKMAQSK